MKKQFFATDDNWAGLITRLTLGFVLFPHGAQKVLGWFGGPGFTNEMNFFTGTLHLPWIVGLLVILVEFLGAISLILGFASRFWAIAIGLLFIGIIFIGGHAAQGFFINWFGTQTGEGYEYHLLVIGLALAIFANGSGKYSIDRRIYSSMKTPV